MKPASARRRDTESVEDSASASGRILSYQRLQPDSSPSKAVVKSGKYAESGKVAVYSSRARQRARAAADPQHKSGTPRSGDSHPSCNTVRPRLSTISLHQIHHYHNQHPNFLDHHGTYLYCTLSSCPTLLQTLISNQGLCFDIIPLCFHPIDWLCILCQSVFVVLAAERTRQWLDAAESPATVAAPQNQTNSGPEATTARFQAIQQQQQQRQHDRKGHQNQGCFHIFSCLRPHTVELTQSPVLPAEPESR